jgi:hypothetical protein
VAWSARNSRAFFFIFVTLRNRKESSKSFDITASVCQFRTSFSWHRGFAASELPRLISCLPLSRSENAEGRGCGRARTHSRGERGCDCLSAAARRRMATRLCMVLRCKGMRRWWISFWRRVRTWRRRIRCVVSGEGLTKCGFEGMRGHLQIFS